MDDLHDIRRHYAAEIRAVANLQSEALVAAFAKVPREHYGDDFCLSTLPVSGALDHD